MKVRLGTLRQLIRECACAGMSETDERMVGDGEGPGEPIDRNDFDMASHLTADIEGLTLGEPPGTDTVKESARLNREIRRYMLQEAEELPDADVDSEVGGDDLGGEGGTGDAGSGEASTGFYTAFDQERDHNSTWYASPGQAAGSAGDPYRSEDPKAQLGFTSGEDTPTTLAPPIWQLSAGSDTSKVLGANAKPDSGGVDSGNGSEDSEAPGGPEGEDGDDSEGAEDSDETEGEESSGGGDDDRDDGQDVRTDPKDTATQKRK